MFLFYLTELSDYTPLNFVDDTTSYSTYGLNRLLTNSLNKYHPLIFYISTSLILSTVPYFLVTTLSLTPFSINSLLSWAVKKNWKVIKFNLLSLFMGSWWALQEGTWGGWWNWDSSEMLGLEISFVALVINHTYLCYRHFDNILFKFMILILVLLATYFFIQLNFELVSHNFGSKFFFFFNNNLFSIEVILFSTYSIFKILKLQSKLSQVRSLIFLNPSILTPVGVSVLLRFLLPLLLASWIFWSYKPLLNSFSWNFLGLNIFNIESSIQIPNLFVALTVLLWITTYSCKLLILFLAFCLLSTNWLWLLVLTSTVNSFISSLHSAILMFTITNLVLPDLTVTDWFPQTSYLSSSTASSTLWISDTSFSADSFSWDFVKGQSELTSRLTSSWDSISLTNTSSTNFFSLNSSHQECVNYYDLGMSYVTLYLEFHLPIVLTLSSFFFMGLTILNFYAGAHWVSSF